VIKNKKIRGIKMEIRSEFKSIKDLKKYLRSLKTSIEFLKPVSELYKYEGDDEATLNFQKTIISYNHRVSEFKNTFAIIEKFDKKLEPLKNPKWKLYVGIYLVFGIVTIPIALWLINNYKKENKLYIEGNENGLQSIVNNEEFQSFLFQIKNLYGTGQEFEYGWEDFSQQISDEINSGRTKNFVQAKIQVKRDNEIRRLKEAEISALEDEANSKNKIAESLNKIAKKK
jgi:hypothetical protein